MNLINKFRRQLEKSEYAKNTFKLASGTAIAQGIPILASIFLARLYSPSEIGTFTFLLSIINLLTILSTCRYEQAIVLPKEEIQGVYVFYLTLFINISVSFFLSIFLFFFNKDIINFFDIEEVSHYLYYIPILVFFNGLYLSYSYWNNRNKDYSIIAYGKILKNSGMVVSQLLLSIYSAGGLILGKMIGDIISLFQFIYKSKHFDKITLNELVKGIKSSFSKYIDFFKYTMPNAFLNYSSNNLPIFLFPRFFSMSETGYYSWSVRIIQTPMSIITKSIQQVFFQKVNYAFNHKINILPIVNNTYKKLFLIGIVPYTLIFIFAPVLFSFIFGSQWQIAGEFTRYLVPWFFLMFLNSPITSIVLVLNKQKEYFLFGFLLFFSRLSAIIGGEIIFETAKGTIILYSIVGLCFNLYLFYYLKKITINYEAKS